MSFIDQNTAKVQIKSQWAVDSVEAMCQSFQVNYPDATVSHGHAWNCALHAAVSRCVSPRAFLSLTQLTL